MKIYYVTAGDGALGLFRCMLPGKFLEQQHLAEVMTTHRQFFKECVDWADLVVMQRIAGPVVESLARYCKMTGTKIVYELDDNVFQFPNSPEYEQASVKSAVDDVGRVLSLCDAATVTTEAIAREARRWCPRAFVLPNCFDPDMVPAWDIRHVGSWVGWMGGHFHFQDLAMIQPALESLLRRREDWTLVMLGACIRSLYEEFPKRVFVHEFVPAKDFFTLFKQLCPDIGLAPLYDNEFGRSRSADRLILYGAYGVASVASRVGSYLELIDSGFPCVAVGGDPWEWVDAIEGLLDNPEKRQGIGRKAREFVCEHWDIRKNVWRWAEAYEQVLGGGS